LRWALEVGDHQNTRKAVIDSAAGQAVRQADQERRRSLRVLVALTSRATRHSPMRSRRAKGSSVPNENIDRAGQAGGGARRPGGADWEADHLRGLRTVAAVAMLIECLTEQTATAARRPRWRTAMTRGGGNLAGIPGSVAYLFQPQGRSCWCRRNNRSEGPNVFAGGPGCRRAGGSRPSTTPSRSSARRPTWAARARRRLKARPSTTSRPRSRRAGRASAVQLDGRHWRAKVLRARRGARGLRRLCRNVYAQPSTSPTTSLAEALNHSFLLPHPIPLLRSPEVHLAHPAQVHPGLRSSSGHGVPLAVAECT